MNLTQTENDHGIIGHPMKTSQMYLTQVEQIKHHRRTVILV